MTNELEKQIIIDGVDVSGCYCYVSTSKEYSCGLTCSKFHYRFCKENPNCHYKKWQRKEQECEELKNIINEAKNSKLDLKSFLVGEAVQNEYEQQLDQLKAKLSKLKSRILCENEDDLLYELMQIIEE